VVLAGPRRDAGPAAIYGLNLQSEGKNVSWVLDGDAARGYRFAYDANGDGSLDDEAWHALTRGPDGPGLELSYRPRAGEPAATMRLLFDDGQLYQASTIRRRGELALPERRLAFTVDCQRGDCRTPAGVMLGFDLDGDGQVDLSQGSFERFSLRFADRVVHVAGVAYQFEVAPDGGEVTLRRLAAAPAPRPTLALGSLAPPFSFEIAGQRRQLEDTRGHVVVLDFFSAGCHFCLEDAPWLRALYDRHAARGLAVITIGDPGARGHALLEPAHAPWWVAIEAEAQPIAARYRIDGYPAYFVIDRDGALVCSRCKRDEADAAVARLLDQAPAR